MSTSTSFSFQYGPRVRCAENAASAMSELLPDGPVLFVTDKGVRSLGLADKAIAALEAAGRAVIVFDAIEADPSATTILACTDAGAVAKVTSVVGFGGGSPMDVAKLAAYLLGSGDTLEAIYGVGEAKGRGLPLALVPTTAGTGSEATPISIVTVGGDEKKGVVSPALYADWAILDATLTFGLPPHVTAATGIDAMVHAIEAFTSARLKNPLSDSLAREALRLLVPNLPLVIRDGRNLAAREAMLLGSHLAGVAFANAPVAGVHALAYPLGGHFHVPHGLSNALMLPHVLRHNMSAAMPLYAELGVICDPSLAAIGQQGQAQAFVEAMAALGEANGLPTRLADVGVERGDLDRLAADAMKQQRLLVNNPCPITEADARRMYETAF